jgi:ribosomal protein S6
MAKDTEEQKDLVETPEMAENEADYAETRVYELGFHIDGELPQEEAKKVYEAIKDLIAKKGTVVAEGTPQKIQLAYTISRMDTTGRRDFDTSFFSWVAYETDGAGHDAVQEAAKAENRIVRFIDLRTSKDAAKHAEEMQEFYLKVPEQSEHEEESAADAELDAALKEAGAAVA